MRLPPLEDVRMRLLKLLAVLLCLIAVAGCSMPKGSKADKLRAAQYAYSGAVRWNDFEGALTLIDPDLREEHKLSEMELERYKQVQISAYNEIGSRVEETGAVRDIEIGVINRHTMAERRVRYIENWRWDEESKTWWLTSKLPDLWQGQ
jgi:hypothetical protein